MSFLHYKETIDEEDTVILYLNPNSLYAIRVKATIVDKTGKTVDNVFQTTYGALKIKNLIGKPYGSKVTLSRGWAFVLHPTPELWTLTLPHRTQIIYTPDISMIVMQLELRPGSVVVESGTGSGSLTHALARAVRPLGRVHTYDFHEKRVETAQEEFESHGLKDIVSSVQRDVCKDGFGADVENKVDAVFLDLPHPWLVIEHAVKAMKHKGGRFCSFSPCVEQVQKTCERLRAAGFTEVQTVECLRREYTVQNRSFPTVQLEDQTEESGSSKKVTQMSCLVLPATVPGHTGYITSASLPPVWARAVSDNTDSVNTLTEAMAT